MIPTEIKTDDAKLNWIINHLKERYKNEKLRNSKSSSREDSSEDEEEGTLSLLDVLISDDTPKDKRNDGASSNNNSLSEYVTKREEPLIGPDSLRKSSNITPASEHVPTVEPKISLMSRLRKKQAENGDSIRLEEIKSPMNETQIPKPPQVQTPQPNHLPEKLKAKVEYWKKEVKEAFSEDATRDQRTLKYSLLIVIFATVYALCLRYSSGDLFLVNDVCGVIVQGFIADIEFWTSIFDKRKAIFYESFGKTKNPKSFEARKETTLWLVARKRSQYG